MLKIDTEPTITPLSARENGILAGTQVSFFFSR